MKPAVFIAALLTSTAVCAEPDGFGVQLYTLRQVMKSDVDATLRQVSELGYREVEATGFFQQTPEAFRAMLDQYHLTVPALHVGLNRLNNHFADAVHDAETIGAHWIVVPWVSPKEYTTIEKFRELARKLNEFSARAEPQGLRIAYHNHEQEFKAIDGQIPFDLLMQETAAAGVDFELDVYWVARAGQDPLVYLKKYPGRIKLCHLKDITPDGQITDVGSGTLDFQKIIQTGRECGVEHFIVEYDHPADPFGSVARSLGYLRNLSFDATSMK